MIPPTVTLEGKTLGHCRLQKKLGEGGMGAVYLARHETLDKPVAVKILPPDLARDEEFVARFLREGRAAAKLEHPNVVQVLDAGSSEGLYFIVMQYVQGVDLDRILNDRKKLPVSEVLAVGRSVAAALAAAHKQGIVHRDIKPANILVTREGRVLVTDFGLARDISAGRTTSRPDQVLGTPLYLSPEQARGDRVDGRADLYSLGATMYTLLSGQPPYKGNTAMSVLLKHADLHARPTRLRELDPSIPPRVQDLVEKLMEKEVAKRFPSAEEVVREIDAIRQAPSMAAVAVKERRRRRRWILIGASGALGGAFVLLVVLGAVAGASEAQRELRALTRRYQEAGDDPQKLEEVFRDAEEFARRHSGTEWAARALEKVKAGRLALLDRALAEIEAQAKEGNEEAMTRWKLLRERQEDPDLRARVEAKESAVRQALVDRKLAEIGELAREGGRLEEAETRLKLLREAWPQEDVRAKIEAAEPELRELRRARRREFERELSEIAATAKSGDESALDRLAELRKRQKDPELRAQVDAREAEFRRAVVDRKLSEIESLSRREGHFSEALDRLDALRLRWPQDDTRARIAQRERKIHEARIIARTEGAASMLKEKRLEELISFVDPAEVRAQGAPAVRRALRDFFGMAGLLIGQIESYSVRTGELTLAADYRQAAVPVKLVTLSPRRPRKEHVVPIRWQRKGGDWFIRPGK